MISVVIESWNVDGRAAPLERLLCTLAPQLGDAELVVTHAGIPERARLECAAGRAITWLALPAAATYYDHKNRGFDVAALGSYGGAFAVGVISSILPLVSIEVFLVALTIATGASLGTAISIVLLAAGGQLAGKLPIYVAGRGIAGVAGPHRKRVERIRQRLVRLRNTPHLALATSALVGLPPFSVMATAAGAFAIRLHWFCGIVFAGRAARFAILIAATILAQR
jgi:membrane protein YqaA with SNARE-associated domain